MGTNELRLEGAAGRLQRMIRALRDGGRLHVRPGAGHLTIELEDADGARLVVARAQPEKERIWRLLVLKAPGRWLPYPASGPLEDVADGLMELMNPRFERAEFVELRRDPAPRLPTWSPSGA